MNERDPLGEPRRGSRIDLATLLIALLALAVAIHCRLYPRWPHVGAQDDSPEAINERLESVERTLLAVEASLGTRDEQGRPIAARLAMVENQSLLFDETLSRLVGHLKTLEETSKGTRSNR